MTDVQRLTLESGGELGENAISALDEDDDEAALLTRVPDDTTQLQACLTAAQGCLLLLMLKQHLKDVYGLSDRYFSFFHCTTHLFTCSCNIQGVP